MKITVYATSVCPYCKMLEDFLNEKKVVYTKKLVDSDEEAQKEMMEESQGFLGVPFVIITKMDGDKEYIMGFDKNKMSAILGV